MMQIEYYIEEFFKRSQEKKKEALCCCILVYHKLEGLFFALLDNLSNFPALLSLGFL